MQLGPNLLEILKSELRAGNSIKGKYIEEFANCHLLVVLNKPFHKAYVPLTGVDTFANRDTHYPVGFGYEDAVAREILLAPFS